MSGNEHLHFSVDEIAKIIQVLTRHSLEPECKHSFEEIMESIFDI